MKSIKLFIQLCFTCCLCTVGITSSKFFLSLQVLSWISISWSRADVFSGSWIFKYLITDRKTEISSYIYIYIYDSQFQKNSILASRVFFHIALRSISSHSPYSYSFASRLSAYYCRMTAFVKPLLTTCFLKCIDTVHFWNSYCNFLPSSGLRSECHVSFLLAGILNWRRHNKILVKLQNVIHAQTSEGK